MSRAAGFGLSATRSSRISELVSTQGLLKRSRGELSKRIRSTGIARVAIGSSLTVGLAVALLRALMTTTHRAAPPLNVVVALLGAELTAVSVAALVSIQPGHPWPSIGLLRRAATIVPWLVLSTIAAALSAAPVGRVIGTIQTGDIAFAAFIAACLLALFALSVLLRSAGGSSWVHLSADLALAAARSDSAYGSAETAILKSLPGESGRHGRSATDTTQSLAVAISFCGGRISERARITRLARTLVRVTEVLVYDTVGDARVRAAAINEAVSGIVQAARALRDSDLEMAAGLLGAEAEALARGALVINDLGDLDRRMRRVLLTAADPAPAKHWVRSIDEEMPGGLGGKTNAMLLFLWRYLDWNGSWRQFVPYVAYEGLTHHKFLGRPAARKQRVVIPYGHEELTAPAVVEMLTVALTGPRKLTSESVVWPPPFDLKHCEARTMLRQILTAGHYGDLSLSGALRLAHRRTGALPYYPFMSAAARPGPLVAALALATHPDEIHVFIDELPAGLVAEASRWLAVSGDRSKATAAVSNILRQLRIDVIDGSVGGRSPRENDGCASYSAQAFADRVVSETPACRCCTGPADLLRAVSAKSLAWPGVHLAVSSCSPVWYGAINVPSHASCAAWGRRGMRALNALIIDGLLSGAFVSTIRAVLHELPAHSSAAEPKDGFSQLFLEDMRRDASYFDDRRWSGGGLAVYRITTVLPDEDHPVLPDGVSTWSVGAGKPALARAIEAYGDKRELWMRTPKGAVVVRAHEQPRVPHPNLGFLSYEPFFSLNPPPEREPS